MKKLLYAVFLLLFSTNFTIGQSSTFNANGWELNSGFGFDEMLKTERNIFDYQIKEKGLYGDVSLRKFWKIIGISASARYTFNTTTAFNKLPFRNDLPDTAFQDYSDMRAPSQRVDLAIGPMFKFPIVKEKFAFLLGAEAGYSFMNKGFQLAQNQSNNIWLDEGIDRDKFTPMARAKAEISFQMAPKWALNLNGHYSHYFNYKSTFVLQNPAEIGGAGGQFDLSSWGGGIAVRYIMGKTEIIPEKKEPVAVNKDIFTKVLDKETGEILKDARVELTNSQGIIFRGITDENGEFTFDDLPQDTYKLEAKLNDVATPINEIFPADFETQNSAIAVTLLHFDPRFTLNGLTVNTQTSSPEGLVYVILKNLESDKVIQMVSEKQSGSFKFQLDPNTDYSIFGRKDNFISEIETITTKGLDRSTTLFTKLSLGLEKAEVGKPVSLENIYYDLDKSFIREEASQDLLKLVQFMNDNPKVRIELDSHTDSRATKAYNLDLSQRRAESVIIFLINNGIKPERLVAKGFGESRPVNNCVDGVECTEEEHQKNRRTEFTVLEN